MLSSPEYANLAEISREADTDAGGGADGLGRTKTHRPEL